MSVPLLELLYEALHSEFGKVIETNNPEGLRQKLYPLRKQHEELRDLSFVVPPEPNKLWIVKRQEKLND